MTAGTKLEMVEEYRRHYTAIAEIRARCIHVFVYENGWVTYQTCTQCGANR